MMESYVNTIRNLYNNAVSSTGEERDRRIDELTQFFSQHRQQLTDDPLADSSQELSYRTMRNLRGSEAVSLQLQRQLDVVEGALFSTQLSVIVTDATKKNNFESVYQWVNAHQTKYTLSAESSVEDILGAVDEVRLNFLERNLYSSQIDLRLSIFVIKLFNLVDRGNGINVVIEEVTKDRDCQLKIIAHLCSRRNEFVAILFSLNQEELKKAASYFYVVPVFPENQNPEWVKNFLKLCKTARVVEINVPLTALSSNDLPPHVEEIKLFNCEIERLSLTLPKLRKLEVYSNLGSIELNAPHLTKLSIYRSHNLNALHLNTPYLEGLYLQTTSLSTLTLDTPFLFTLLMENNTHLDTITLVHPDKMRDISFEGCTSLRSILEPGRGLPNCQKLNLYNCPAAIPQVPTTAQVFTGTRQNKGSILSFRVNPKDLAEKPLQVLLDFAKIFEKQTYFPNIIWVNPLTEVEAEGVDAGGLRRHFVASLTENLAFPLNEEGIPLLEDKLALETYGRLIGFAAESSLLFGSTLPLEFFYRVLSDDDALQEVIKGVKATLGPKWEKWKRNPQETDGDFASRVRLFADQVQGKPVTAENLFPLLQFDGENTLKTEEYIQRFFSEFPLLVDERVFQLKHFHQMMLGSLSLEGRPITIHVKGPGEALPPIHACSGEMQIPTYTDYQTFKNKLMWALRALDTFETI